MQHGKKGEESVTLRVANLSVIIFSLGKNRIELKLVWRKTVKKGEESVTLRVANLGQP